MQKQIFESLLEFSITLFLLFRIIRIRGKPNQIPWGPYNNSTTHVRKKQRKNDKNRYLIILGESNDFTVIQNIAPN